MLTRDQQGELDLRELTALPELREVAMPKLSAFRRLQLWATVAAVIWTLGALGVADHLIRRETQHEVEDASANARVEAGYVARLLEEKLFEAERLATTLALQDSIVRAVRALNERAPDIEPLSAADRYRHLVADPDARVINDYFKRLASSLDLNQIFLLNRTGTCVASSQWDRPDICVPANYGGRRYFREAEENGAARQFALGRQVRTPSFFFSNAIRDNQGFQGAIVVRITSDEITGTLLNGGLLTLVTDRYGVVVGSNDKSMLLRHVGESLSPLPDPERMRQIYGVDRLDGIGAVRAKDAPHGLELWRRDGTLYILTTTVVRGGDLSVVRFIPAEPFLAVAETGWSLAAAAVVMGLLIIILIERTSDYAARRQAHLSALSGANATLSWVARRLYDLAVSDSLTGAANRRYFMQRLEQEVERSNRAGRPLSLAMLDIDHFKRINDTHGHPVGDEAIRALAIRCMELVRGYDIVGRLGGEEFAILLPDTDAAQASEVAERIRAWLSGRAHRFGDSVLSFTCSVGVATLKPGWSAEQILKAADHALYAAKENGRDRVEVDGRTPPNHATGQPHGTPDAAANI